MSLVNSVDVNDLFSLWHSFWNAAWAISSQTCLFPSYFSFSYVYFCSASKQNGFFQQIPKISIYGTVCLEVRQADPGLKQKYLLSSMGTKAYCSIQQTFECQCLHLPSYLGALELLMYLALGSWHLEEKHCMVCLRKELSRSLLRNWESFGENNLREAQSCFFTGWWMM